MLGALIKILVPLWFAHTKDKKLPHCSPGTELAGNEQGNKDQVKGRAEIQKHLQCFTSVISPKCSHAEKNCKGTELLELLFVFSL